MPTAWKLSRKGCRKRTNDHGGDGDDRVLCKTRAALHAQLGALRDSGARRLCPRHVAVGTAGRRGGDCPPRLVRSRRALSRRSGYVLARLRSWPCRVSDPGGRQAHFVSCVQFERRGLAADWDGARVTDELRVPASHFFWTGPRWGGPLGCENHAYTAPRPRPGNSAPGASPQVGQFLMAFSSRPAIPPLLEQAISRATSNSTLSPTRRCSRCAARAMDRMARRSC